MVSYPNEDCWGFIIDTDSYAGNFERDLCAYVTGQVGECGVGKSLVEKLPIDFSELVMGVADEHGCIRPCSIFMNPKTKIYTSVVIYFYRKPTKKQIEFMKERVHHFSEAFKVQNFRVAKFKSVVEIKEV